MTASIAATLAQLVSELPGGETVGQLLDPVLGRAVLRAAPTPVRQDDIHRRCRCCAQSALSGEEIVPASTHTKVSMGWRARMLTAFLN